MQSLKFPRGFHPTNMGEGWYVNLSGKRRKVVRKTGECTRRGPDSNTTGGSISENEGRGAIRPWEGILWREI